MVDFTNLNKWSEVYTGVHKMNLTRINSSTVLTEGIKPVNLSVISPIVAVKLNADVPEHWVLGCYAHFKHPAKNTFLRTGERDFVCDINSETILISDIYSYLIPLSLQLRFPSYLAEVLITVTQFEMPLEYSLPGSEERIKEFISGVKNQLLNRTIEIEVIK
jgi:hypothetical protein